MSNLKRFCVLCLLAITLAQNGFASESGCHNTITILGQRIHFEERDSPKTIKAPASTVIGNDSGATYVADWTVIQTSTANKGIRLDLHYRLSNQAETADASDFFMMAKIIEAHGNVAVHIRPSLNAEGKIQDVNLVDQAFKALLSSFPPQKRMLISVYSPDLLRRATESVLSTHNIGPSFRIRLSEKMDHLHFSMCMDFGCSPKEDGIHLMDRDIVEAGAYGETFKIWWAVLPAEWNPFELMGLFQSHPNSNQTLAYETFVNTILDSPLVATLTRNPEIEVQVLVGSGQIGDGTETAATTSPHTLHYQLLITND